jgi:hypothetical protein
MVLPAFHFVAVLFVLVTACIIVTVWVLDEGKAIVPIATPMTIMITATPTVVRIAVLRLLILPSNTSEY